VFLFLFGVGGTGKGTVVKTVTSIMGDYTITAPMELFTAQGFRPSEYYRATMAGKRLLVAAETEQTGYWAEAFIKEITGGDKLSARHPAGKPFNFDPTHKPLLHGNHMPKMRGRSTAMERRLRIALFNNKPETPDTELKEKLRAEWPAILRWMIDGCLSWQMNGLQPPDAVTKANQSYFETQDILGRWIEDCCILDPNLQEEPAKLRASFNRWSRDNDLEEMSANAFADILNLFEDAPLKRIKDHDGKRWIRGIGLQVTPEQQSQQQRRQGERDDD
jgi:putative DNA primase/helicase